MRAATLHAPWWAYASLAASMTLVGSYVGLSKLLVAVFPVFLLAWLRFGIAAVAMLGWLHRAPGEPALTRRDRWLLFWESFLGNFLFSICMLFGVALTSAVAAGVIMAAIPAAVALLSRAFLGERIGARVAVGIACAIGGIALLSLTRGDAQAGPSDGANPWLGNLLLVGAVFCEACYVVIGKQLTGNVSAKRIAALVNWPLENGEGIQILRYGPGAEYKPHHDYFDPVHPGTATILRRGGQRVGTVVMYLNTPDKGGATVFPDVGLDVAPVRGNAVFFAYDRPHPSTRTLHGGAPVIAGVKWVATK